MKASRKHSLLDLDELNEDFFADALLLGITATIKNYKFCLQLNSMLNYNFRMNPELEIELRRKSRSYYFPVYHHAETANALHHYLYYNQYQGEYLLPEFRHMDFLWLMKGDCVEQEYCDGIIQSVRSITGVQLVAELTNEQIRNKGNMVF